MQQLSLCYLGDVKKGQGALDLHGGLLSLEFNLIIYLTTRVTCQNTQEVVQQMEAHYPPQSFPGLTWVQGDCTSLEFAGRLGSECHLIFCTVLALLSLRFELCIPSLVPVLGIFRKFLQPTHGLRVWF